MRGRCLVNGSQNRSNDDRNYRFTYIYPKWNIWPGKSQMSPFFQKGSLHLSQVKLSVKKAARLCGFCVVFATKTKQKLPQDTIFFTYRLQQRNKSWFGILGANKKGHIEKFKDKNYKSEKNLQKFLTKDLTIKHIDTFPTLPTLRAGTNSKSELETSAFPQICLFKKRLDTFHLLFKMKVLKIDTFWVRKSKSVWKRALQIGPFFPKYRGWNCWILVLFVTKVVVDCPSFNPGESKTIQQKNVVKLSRPVHWKHDKPSSLCWLRTESNRHVDWVTVH